MEERKTVSWQEIAYSNMLNIESVVNLLIRKGLMTKEEILEEIELLKHKEHRKPD